MKNVLQRIYLSARMRGLDGKPSLNVVAGEMETLAKWKPYRPSRGSF